jgi:hypothetical protein
MLGYSAYNCFLRSSAMLFELQTIRVALNGVKEYREGCFKKKKSITAQKNLNTDHQDSNLKTGPPWVSVTLLYLMYNYVELHFCTY